MIMGGVFLIERGAVVDVHAAARPLGKLDG